MHDAEITILDGGMGKLLEREGAPFHQPEWSALALLQDPATVRHAHDLYIAAGADVITTNAYAVVPFHIGEDRFKTRGAELAGLAGRLAREAADAAARPVRVAGSLPPLFGSYQPELFDPDRAPEMLDVLIEAQAPFADLWIAETMSSIAEAKAVIAALDRYDPDAELWISYTVPDVRPEPSQSLPLRSGESIAAAVDAVRERVTAILFNCSPPEAIEVALRDAAEALSNHPGVRLGGYANAFEEKKSGYAANEALLGRRDDQTPHAYRATAERWIDIGTTIIGGCCHMFPEHIEALESLRTETE